MPDAIVVTYHSEASIGACLDALLEGDLHVVVVDNAATADVVRQRFPKVELIANHENVGFSRAVNQGLARCKSDVVGPAAAVISSLGELSLLDGAPRSATAHAASFRS